MKASEVMIGDWVYNKENQRNEMVSEISGDSNYVMLLTNHLYEFDEIEPIPLTAEILEKNGWVLNLSNDKYQQDFPHDTVADFSTGRTETFYDYVELEYEQSCASWIMTVLRYFKCWVDNVHELQHALRLCRINKNIEL